MFWLFWIVFALACVGLVYFVLSQEPKQGGLGSSMGGSGGGDGMFDSRGVAGGIIRITVILAGIFMLLALLFSTGFLAR